eukprot:6201273-Pleurochrysis_carterae.AAC.2
MRRQVAARRQRAVNAAAGAEQRARHGLARTRRLPRPQNAQACVRVCVGSLVHACVRGRVGIWLSPRVCECENSLNHPIDA